jgi:predicted DNA-binding transcriptional regulator YafY
MNRIDRLFGMLTFLQSRKFVPAQKIAEKFQISVRTVYRDIKSLCEQGIPISFEQYKGYFLVQGFFLPPVSFSSEEANALLLMEPLVHGFTDKSIEKHYSNVFNKIKSVLKSSQKDNMEILHHSTRFQLPPCLNPDFDHLSLLQMAISSKNILEIGYENNNGQKSLRMTEPIGLVFYAFNWHLIAWDYKSEEYRDFRVSRILELKNTGNPFSKTDHIDLNQYMENIPVNY